jgi:hypothetical protein
MHTHCVATDDSYDNTGNVIIFNGSRWSSPVALPSSWAADAISCVPRGRAKVYCLAASSDMIDSNGDAQVFDGTPREATKAAHWRLESVAGADTLWDASCPAPRSCFAVTGDSPDVFQLRKGTWSHSFVGPPYPYLISCGSPTYCWLAGSSSSNDTNVECSFDGSTWSCGRSNDAHLKSISCARGTTFCMAVDSQGHASSYSGSQWTAPARVPGGHPLNDVSCPLSTFCMAVGGTSHQGSAIPFGSGTWGTQSVVSAHGPLDAVSCASSSFCMAIGGRYGEEVFEYSVPRHS